VLGRHSRLFHIITKESSEKKKIYFKRTSVLILSLLTCSLTADVIRGYHPRQLGDIEWLTKFGRRMDCPSEYFIITNMTG
jgi:hypothetical protein